eukprot:NODE_42_length_3928_cov_29.629286_g36_i0.p1 GENE.NODE_42_length_3928_cov_29.629286_g36_i0~~NODE_42_length_3928_cov_29.629286_g36_i0.p1  ORF type:complete len:1243 (-),score=248.23 NODE_42_length_3928_cov_29.629286_g36_i0:198-3488(-)
MEVLIQCTKDAQRLQSCLIPSPENLMILENGIGAILSKRFLIAIPDYLDHMRWRFSMYLQGPFRKHIKIHTHTYLPDLRRSFRLLRIFADELLFLHAPKAAWVAMSDRSAREANVVNVAMEERFRAHELMWLWSASGHRILDKSEDQREQICRESERHSVLRSRRCALGIGVAPRITCVLKFQWDDSEKLKGKYFMKFDKSGKESTGRMTMCAPITIDSRAMRLAMNIPLEGTHFAYAWPLIEFDTPLHLVNLASEQTLFACFGGFLYFAGDQLIQINALFPGGSSIPLSAWVQLEQQHVQELNWFFIHEDLGLTSFNGWQALRMTWLMPSECARISGGTHTNGAFAFEFADDDQCPLGKGIRFAYAPVGPPAPCVSDVKASDLEEAMLFSCAEGSESEQMFRMMIKSELEWLGSMKMQWDYMLDPHQRTRVVTTSQREKDIMGIQSAVSQTSDNEWGIPSQSGDRHLSRTCKALKVAISADMRSKPVDMKCLRVHRIAHKDCVTRGRQNVIEEIAQIVAQAKGTQWAQFPLNVAKRSLVLHLVFLILLLICAFLHPLFTVPYRELTSRDALFGPILTGDAFTEIQDIASLHTWLEGDFANTLWPSTLGYDRYSVQNVTEILGAVRLRQMRIRNGTCHEEHFEGQNAICAGRFLKEDLETSSTYFGRSYVFGSAATQRGTYGSYEPDGYTVDLPGRPVTDQHDTIKDLRSSGWIDSFTRVFVTDFTLWVPNNQDYATCTIIFEFPASGGIAPATHYLHYVNPSFTPSPLMLIIVIALWIYVALLIIEEVSEVVPLLRARKWADLPVVQNRDQTDQKLNLRSRLVIYLTSDWNFMDILQTVMLFATLTMMSVAAGSLPEVESLEDHNVFYDFSKVTQDKRICRWLMGVTVIITFLNCGTFMRFVPYLGLRLNTIFLTVMSGDVFNVLLIYIGVVAAFVTGLHIMLRSQEFWLSENLYSMWSVVSWSIADTTAASDVRITDPEVQVVYFLSIVLLHFMIFNMLIAVVTVKYEEIESSWYDTWLWTTLRRAHILAEEKRRKIEKKTRHEDVDIDHSKLHVARYESAQPTHASKAAKKAERERELVNRAQALPGEALEAL